MSSIIPIYEKATGSRIEYAFGLHVFKDELADFRKHDVEVPDGWREGEDLSDGKHRLMPSGPASNFKPLTATQVYVWGRDKKNGFRIIKGP